MGKEGGTQPHVMKKQKERAPLASSECAKERVFSGR